MLVARESTEETGFLRRTRAMRTAALPPASMTMIGLVFSKDRTHSLCFKLNGESIALLQEPCMCFSAYRR